CDNKLSDCPRIDIVTAQNIVKTGLRWNDKRVKFFFRRNCRLAHNLHELSAGSMRLIPKLIYESRHKNRNRDGRSEGARYFIFHRAKYRRPASAESIAKEMPQGLLFAV